MNRALAVVLLLLAGCAVTERPWRFTGAPRPADWDEKLPRLVAASRTVSGDRKEWLKAGGVVIVYDTMEAIDGRCPVKPGWHVAGCAGPGGIDILLFPPKGIGPDLYRTALAHELCHLGLTHGGGMWHGPVVGATEPEADACGEAAERLAETLP